MGKRMVCLWLILLSLPGLSGCAKSPGMNPKKGMRLNFENYSYWVKDENSAELIRLLNKMDYDEELCFCTGDLEIRVGDQSLELKLDEYARWKGKQHTFDLEEASVVGELIEKIKTEKKGQEDWYTYCD